MKGAVNMTGYESIPRFHDVYEQVPEQFRPQFLMLLDQVPERERATVLTYALQLADAIKHDDVTAFMTALALLGAPVELAPMVYQTFREVYLREHHD